MMFKKTMVSAMALAVSLAGFFGSVSAQDTVMQDVPAPQAAVDGGMTVMPSAINRVVASGLMAGYPDGKFHPEGLLTRAELAHILVKTFKLDTRTPRVDGVVAMQDVPVTHWAYHDIQTVLRNEVMEGYREGLFYPNQKITRAEAFAILAQAYGVFSWDEQTVSEVLASYPDAAQIPAWAQKAMATALKEGFVNTDDAANRIHPQQPMTRGDMAFALNRYLDRLHGPQAEQAPVAQ